ncbi:MAG: hypothetical protein A3E82_05340 [Gammaproteobacteria bacterium RIFCSPHIGHO2_12_FULL_38_11]|nr:MAG: hypothetical protein A3E82_05340 [Gammaproteobacteria bacterium RIFCSPHIGHO2_12_FULL_38_11]
MYTKLILFFMFAISISFLCSLWEAVLLSITPTYTQIKLHENSFIGKKLQYFKKNIDKPLAAILSLNTFAHTVGAIGVGEQALLIWSHTTPFITGFLVPILMTLAILILSEIIPKSIGANFWKELVSFTVYSLNILLQILFPFVWLCQLITKRFRRGNDKSILSRSDFLALTEIGEQQGIFKKSEADLIEKVLDLYELRVTEVMRPANEMVMINKNQSFDTLISLVKKYRYSRYPVFDPNNNEINGIIHVKDLFDSKKDGADLTYFVRPVLKIPTRLPVTNLLSRFKAGMPHFALVYKDKIVVGFVTLDNVLQVLLGIIKDEFNRSHVAWTAHEDGSISAKGSCSLYALEQFLDADINVDETHETVAELIIHRLNKIPKEKERIEFDEFIAVIEKMNASHIQTVRIYPKSTSKH